MKSLNSAYTYVLYKSSYSNLVPPIRLNDYSVNEIRTENYIASRNWICLIKPKAHLIVLELPSDKTDTNAQFVQYLTSLEINRFTDNFGKCLTRVRHNC